MSRTPIGRCSVETPAGAHTAMVHAQWVGTEWFAMNVHEWFGAKLITLEVWDVQWCNEGPKGTQGIAHQLSNGGSEQMLFRSLCSPYLVQGFLCRSNAGDARDAHDHGGTHGELHKEFEHLDPLEALVG